MKKTQLSLEEFLKPFPEVNNEVFIFEKDYFGKYKDLQIKNSLATKDFYIMQEVGTNNFKIGISSDPFKRKYQLQANYACEVQLLYIIKEGRGDILEVYLKNKLQEYKIKGRGTEWFNLSPEILLGVICDLLIYYRESLSFERYKTWIPIIEELIDNDEI